MDVQKQECEDVENSEEQSENVSDHDTQSSSESDRSTMPSPIETVPVSASRRKIVQHNSQDIPEKNKVDNSEIVGHRLVDMQRLSSALSDLHKCEDGKILAYFFVLSNLLTL